MHVPRVNNLCFRCSFKWGKVGSGKKDAETYHTCPGWKESLKWLCEKVPRHIPFRRQIRPLHCYFSQSLPSRIKIYFVSRFLMFIIRYDFTRRKNISNRELQWYILTSSSIRKYSKHLAQFQLLCSGLHFRRFQWKFSANILFFANCWDLTW